MSVYSRITSTMSQSFCVTTSSASLTELTPLLPQSRDCSCYVSRQILAPAPLWLQKHTDLRAHEFAHFDFSLHSLTLSAPEVWDVVELILLYNKRLYFIRCNCVQHGATLWRYTIKFLVVKLGTILIQMYLPLTFILAIMCSFSQLLLT
jgi:hypothetical protein